MTDPTSRHKPYRTGARPSTTAAKANVHMSSGGWIRTITATDYAWAGNDNTDADPEVLVAFRGSGSLQGWYAHTYWANTVAISQATPAAIDLHVHFSENVTVTGNPTMTITNDQGGTGGGGTAATVVCTWVSHYNSIEHIGLFRSAVPSANHLKEGDVLHLGANALALAGGTIKDKGTTTNTLITAAADVGYHGGVNRGGDIAADGSTIELGGPRAIVLA